MMNIGFLYSLKPGLEEIYSDPDKRQSAYKRHLEYFNTNPYLSPILMGVVLNLEERLNKGEIQEDIIRDAKEGLMTALAALGDGFFWDSWRPFVAALALIFAFGNYLLTPIIFLILYNIPHLYFRFFGIFWGYRLGTDVIRLISKFRIQETRTGLRFGTIALLCYLIPNHVNIHSTLLLGNNMPIEYFYWGEKIVQGVGASILVTMVAVAYRAKIDVFMISFLLMISALVLYHWGILI